MAGNPVYSVIRKYRGNQSLQYLLHMIVLAAVLSAFITERAYGQELKGMMVGLKRPLTLPLAGAWSFQEDPKSIGEQETWNIPGHVRARTIPVPLPWELAFDDLRGFSG